MRFEAMEGRHEDLKPSGGADSTALFGGPRAAAAGATRWAAASPTELQQQNERLREQLRIARQWGRCHRCGDIGHGHKDCPLNADKRPTGGPPGRSGTPPPPLRSSQELWLLDSGATHHMSSGRPRGAGAFSEYRTLRPPYMVSFGKRGSAAPAEGVGHVAVQGARGTEVLRDVLHVPDLAVSLFSVRAALDSGMDVYFRHAMHAGGSSSVVLVRGGAIVLTASEREGLFFIDSQVFAAHAGAAAVSPEQLREATEWHRRLGHMGFSTLADLARSGMIRGCPVTPAAFEQARAWQVCEPCITTKMRRTSHPPRVQQPVRVLHRIHADLCQLGAYGYVSTTIDEATRHSTVSILRFKSAAAADVRQQIRWRETQTGLPVQRFRSDRGGEYYSNAQQEWCAEKGIQLEPTAGYSPEANGLAERHNLTLLDMAMPMLADSGDERYGLPPLGPHHIADAIIYANDLHNATPSSAATTGATPHEGFLGRAVTLGAFPKFGGRVWIHVPHETRRKPGARGVPGRFLGYARPFGSNIVRVKLDSGGERASQTVVFGDRMGMLPPVLLPVPGGGVPAGPPGGGEVGDSDSDSESDADDADALGDPAGPQLDGEAPGAQALAPPPA